MNRLQRFLLHRQARSADNWVVGALVIATVVLGWIGWSQLDAHKGVQFDFLARVDGTVGLLVFNAPQGSVPLALGFARLTGAAATTGVVVSAALVFGHAQLHRWVAARAKHHTLLVGPAERVAPYLPETTVDGGVVVHARDIGELAMPDIVEIEIDPLAEDWGARLGLGSVQRVVIATGRDDVNATVLARVRTAAPTADVTVEIDDRSASIALALALKPKPKPDPDPDPDPAASTSDQSTACETLIDVVCPGELLASAAADKVVRNPLSRRPIVVIGDGTSNRLITLRIADRLATASQIASSHRPVLIAFDPGSSSPVPGRDDTNLSLRATTMFEQVFEWTTGPLIAIVSYQDPARAAQVAIEVAAIRPGSEVHVAATVSEYPLPGLVPLQIGSLHGHARVEGLWAQLARCRHTVQMERSGRPESWDHMTPAERRAEAIAARRITFALPLPGWQLLPDARADRPIKILDATTIERLEALAPGTFADLLIDQLATVGIALVEQDPPATTSEGPTAT